jgi:hypothetical protein
MTSSRVWGAAWAACVLALLQAALLLRIVESAGSLVNQLPVDATGAIDYAKLERVRSNSRYSGSISDLAQQLVVETDLVSLKTHNVNRFSHLSLQDRFSHRSLQEAVCAGHHAHLSGNKTKAARFTEGK